MGDTKKPRKQFHSPRRPWDKNRLEEEAELKKVYGFKNKRELRRIEALVTNKRQTARHLLALPLEQRSVKEKEFLTSLNRIGLLEQGATLDNVLGLSVKGMLERRLQTIVWRKNLAKTIKQARQFIVHGHIAVNGEKVDRPNYIVDKSLEGSVAYFKGPLILEPPKKESRAKESLKEAFEETLQGKEKIKKIDEVSEEVELEKSVEDFEKEVA